jgi:adenylyl- and sulfurtransferase ThiI
MKNVLLILYGEIALRGKNRGRHEAGLIETVAERIGRPDGYMLYPRAGADFAGK